MVIVIVIRVTKTMYFSQQAQFALHFEVGAAAPQVVVRALIAPPND